MEQLTLWSEEVPASPSPSQESEKVLRELLDSCSSTYVVFKSLCLGGSCGKTSRERSRVKGGAAFGQLLREMDALGYGLAWRVLDAQFFGVAQRRERLFLVGHLGDARACEVLFEPESMCWDTPSSREKRKAVAAASGRSVAQGGDAGCLNPADPQSKRIYTPESCAPTLSSGTTEGMNIQPSVFSIAGNIIGRKPENGGNGGGFQEPGEPMYTLTTIDRPAVAFKYHQGSKAGGIGAAVEQSPTLTADYHNPAVMYEESETCTAGLSETGQANQGGAKDL